jgi:hypothetical protein
VGHFNSPFEVFKVRVRALRLEQRAVGALKADLLLADDIGRWRARIKRVIEV